MAFSKDSLVIDYKKLQRIPVRDRAKLAQSPFGSEIFGNLTPSQIAALFPNYYKEQLNSMAGQSSGFGAAALSTVKATGAGVGYNAGATGGTGGGTATTASPTTTMPSKPASPEYVNAVLEKAGIKENDDLPKGKIGLYRTPYELSDVDISDEVVRTVAGEARLSSPEGIDAVINVMLNRVGSSEYGSNLAQVAAQGQRSGGVQFAGYNKGNPTKEQAAYIRERIRKLAAGAEPDNTYGANEFRASYYVYGEGQGKDFYRDAEKQGFVNIGGNIFAARGNYKGPHQGYSKEEIQKRIEDEANKVPGGELGGTSPIDKNPQVDDTAAISLRKADGSFDTSVFDKVDPRLKQYWDTATAAEKRRLELALEKLGVQGTQDVMAKYPKTSETTAVTLLESRVDQQQATLAGTRKLPLQPELVDTMSYAAQKISEETGRNIHFKTFSGGQAKIGTAGPRTGSTEHDEGGAADSYFIETLPDGTERRLSLANPEDKALMYRTAYHFARAGGRSVGLESGYMGDESIHLGISRNNEDPTHHADRELSAVVDQGKQEFLQEAKTKGWNEHYGYRNFIEEYKKSQKATADIAPTTSATAPITPNQPVGGDTAAQPMIHTNQTPQQPVAPTPQPSANTAPAMKLGGTKELDNANKVDEPLAIVNRDGEKQLSFNQNEEVNIKDGQAQVKNEYKKGAEEIKEKTQTEQPEQQNRMKVIGTSIPTKNPWADKVAEGYYPQSPSASRAFEQIKPDRHWERGNQPVDA